MKLDPNAPAFPVVFVDVFGQPHVSGGLTVRQEFARVAMQELSSLADLSYEKIAEMAVNQADALLAELNKETT